MLSAEYRNHDNANVRIWTPEDAEFGSFQVVTVQELSVIVQAFKLMGGIVWPAENANTLPKGAQRINGDQIEVLTKIHPEVWSPVK